MADADEDAVRAPATASTEPDIDLSDETQDFRFLNHLNLYEHLSDMAKSPLSIASITHCLHSISRQFCRFLP